MFNEFDPGALLRAATWQLSWTGLIEPSLPVPSFLGVALMRRNVHAQFSGLVAEIERRQAAAPAQPGLRISSSRW